jgi:hypothetical protein
VAAVPIASQSRIKKKCERLDTQRDKELGATKNEVKEYGHKWRPGECNRLKISKNKRKAKKAFFTFTAFCG